MKRNLLSFTGLPLATMVLALAPAAFAATTPSATTQSGHSHTESARDRSPHVHDRGTVAHH